MKNYAENLHEKLILDTCLVLVYSPKQPIQVTFLLFKGIIKNP